MVYTVYSAWINALEGENIFLPLYFGGHVQAHRRQKYIIQSIERPVIFHEKTVCAVLGSEVKKNSLMNNNIPTKQ